jgi:hypothetical protein
MDIPIPVDPGAPDEFPSDTAGWAAEFRRQVQIVEEASREVGLRWDEPEGRFVASLLGMMQRLARLSAATKASFEATVKQADATIMAELEAVRELRRSVEAIKGQTQAVQVMATVEREHAIQRMIEGTLPLFAERLQRVLVVREARWNADQARKRYATAGLVFLGVFLGGYGLATWAQHDRVALAEHCLTTAVRAEGGTYCVLAEAPPRSPSGSNTR